MNAVLAIVIANLRRYRNDRSNLFFMIVLPLLIVFALSTAFGSGADRTYVGVVDAHPTATSAALTNAVRANPGMHIVRVGSIAELKRRLARSDLDAGWAIAPARGRTTETLHVRWYDGVTASHFASRSVVQSAADATSLGAAVADYIRQSGHQGSADAHTGLPPTAVLTSVVGGSTAAERSSSDAVRGVLAGGELTLFMFLTTLMGAQQLLLTRQYGVTRRMRAGPVSVAQIIAGEAASRYLIALIQAAIVIAGCALLFGVNWQSPAAVFVLALGMALVGTGASMILGSVARSEQQASAIGLMLSLLLAALGGSMTPLEFFPTAMKHIAFAITPHAWMNDALWRVLTEHAQLHDVLGNVAVLFGVGAVLLAAAVPLLARRLR